MIANGANPATLSQDLVEKRLNKLLAEVESAKSAKSSVLRSKLECALVVDTYVMACIHKNSQLQTKFLHIASVCRSVICARVSPAQKSQVVDLVRQTDKQLVTLAIGDGANDVPMIQSAHIGVGISGQEGLQAVNSSDFSIAQFRFLKRLLLVHGRWSLRRVAFVVMYIFYKNILQCLPAFYFAFENHFSGQLLFNVWITQSFNLVGTGLPIMLYGVLDRDVDAKTLLRFPSIYREGQTRAFFSIKTMVWWFGLSLVHALVSYLVPLGVFPSGTDA